MDELFSALGIILEVLATSISLKPYAKQLAYSAQEAASLNVLRCSKISDRSIYIYIDYFAQAAERHKGITQKKHWSIGHVQNWMAFQIASMMTSFPGVRERCIVRLALPRLEAVQGRHTRTLTNTPFRHLNCPSQYELCCLCRTTMTSKTVGGIFGSCWASCCC